MTDPDIQPTLDSDDQTEQASATTEARKVPDGHVVVRLVTVNGEADVVVPPRNKWRSTARNRFAQGDDMGWAVLTLTREDAEAWIDLDPDQDESQAFFREYDRLAPEGNRADRRAKRGHLRAAS